jgi:hypothetical protein
MKKMVIRMMRNGVCSECKLPFSKNHFRKSVKTLPCNAKAFHCKKQDTCQAANTLTGLNLDLEADNTDTVLARAHHPGPSSPDPSSRLWSNFPYFPPNFPHFPAERRGRKIAAMVRLRCLRLPATTSPSVLCDNFPQASYGGETC